jgi:hypothetical protein
MESESKIAVLRGTQESKRPPSDKLRAAVPSLCDDDDEEVITIRAPIAQLIGTA